MPKPVKGARPQVVTGNDLFEGDVVYFTPEHGWTRDHGAAAVAVDADEAAALLAAAKAQPERIVGPYLAEAEFGPDQRPRPIHYRERIRTLGPTIPVGPDNALLGKQAEA